MQMIQNLSKNWRTTSLGLTSMAGAVVNLMFAIRGGTDSQGEWMTAITTILAGLGLIFAGDSAASAVNHDETLNELATIKEALKSGDTSMINKSVAPQPPKP